MRNWTKVILLGGLIVVAVCSGAWAGDRRSGIGFGFSSGTIDPDGGGETEWSGGTVFGKIGFTDNWGLLLSVRSMEDDENLALVDGEYDQFSAHGVYMWRPDKTVRPHVKFGMSRVDLEAQFLPGFLNLKASDAGAGFSLGGGLEAGSPKVAFFADFELVVVELFSEDVGVANLTLGVMFKL